MAFDSVQKLAADIARLQQEAAARDSRLSVVERRQTTGGGASGGITAAPTEQPMTNLIRNGDHNHSVNTWFESAPSGGKTDFECANVYTSAPDAARRVTDGAMTAGSATLYCAQSAPFVAADAGKRIVVAGAGASNAALVTTIQTFVSATEVALAATAATTVASAAVRFRLQKITKKNAKANPADAATDALKAAAHAEYVTNINDPDWHKTSGAARLGSTNTLNYPFGYYNPAGTDFIESHSLYPGRRVNARVNLARANQYVKPKGRLTLGVWNNADAELRYAAGADFTLQGGVAGTPTAVAPAQFLLLCQTQQGFAILSQILTIADYPTESSFSQSVYGAFSWTRFAGAINYQIYRRIGNGNVFLLESIPSGSNSYQDRNTPLRQDTGGTAFPNPPNAQTGVSAFVATAPNALDDLPVDGAGNWAQIKVQIPFPSSINLGSFSDPVLIVGLTEPCALEVRDAAANNTATITSAAAQFAAHLVGKAFTLTDPASGNSVAGTIASVASPTEITLSAPAGFAAANCVLEIAGGAPRGILLDLVGASVVGTDWNNHPEDISGRPQQAASNPNGSTQGGINPGDGAGDGGRVIVRCFLESECVSAVTPDAQIEEVCAADLRRGMRVFYGEFAADGAPLANRIVAVRRHIVPEIVFLRCAGESDLMGVTNTHRWASNETLQHGFATANLSVGDNLLQFADGRFTMKTVVERFAATGTFTVISIELAGDDPQKQHLFLLGGKLAHNLKVDRDENSTA